MEEQKRNIMSKNLDIINFVVSLIIKAFVIQLLSDQSHLPIRRTGPHMDAPKMAPFSLVEPYNRSTTQQPVISKFCEISVS